ncbi:MAG: histidinol-phosphate transaminase [Desulfobacterales bacterium]
MLKLPVPPRLFSIPPYVPGKPIEELERERGISGSIKLASNENPLGPSPRALEALRGALGTLHRYPDSAGFRLTRKIAGRLGVHAEQVVLGNGSDEILSLLARAFLSAGDEVLLPQPAFAMYEIEARAAGAVPVAVPLRDFRTDLEAMAARLTPRTRIVFLNSPHNPTGHVIPGEEVADFAARLPEGVILVLDEAYYEFVRAPRGPDSVSLIRSGRPVVGLRTFSKAYGLAGLRVGYGLMPPEIAALLHRVRPPFNVNLAAQIAAEAALDDEPFLEESRRVVHAGIDFLRGHLERLGLACLPSEANFLMFEVSGDARAVYEGLLGRGVIVRPLAAYGYPRHLRVSAGRPEENRRFLEALRAVLGR